MLIFHTSHRDSYFNCPNRSLTPSPLFTLPLVITAPSNHGNSLLHATQPIRARRDEAIYETRGCCGCSPKDLDSLAVFPLDTREYGHDPNLPHGVASLQQR